MPTIATELENGGYKSKPKRETKENLREKAKVITAAKSRPHWRLTLLPLGPMIILLLSLVPLQEGETWGSSWSLCQGCPRPPSRLVICQKHS